MMKYSSILSLLFCILHLGGAIAQAETLAPNQPISEAEDSQEPEDSQDALPLVSVTFSPLHFIISTLEVTGEYRIMPKLSVALIGGYGSLEIKNINLTLFEAGAQARYYLLGDFEHGMQIGAEFAYISISGKTNDDDVDISALGQGFGTGAFLGYKIAADIGFTFDFQIGVQKISASAEAKASDSDVMVQSEEKSGSDMSPLVNLNFGWSF